MTVLNDYFELEKIFMAILFIVEKKFFFCLEANILANTQLLQFRNPDRVTEKTNSTNLDRHICKRKKEKSFSW